MYPLFVFGSLGLTVGLAWATYQSGRLLRAVLTIFLVITFAFFVLHLSGDPAMMIEGSAGCTPIAVTVPANSPLLMLVQCAPASVLLNIASGESALPA